MTLDDAPLTELDLQLVPRQFRRPVQRDMRKGRLNTFGELRRHYDLPRAVLEELLDQAMEWLEDVEDVEEEGGEVHTLPTSRRHPGEPAVAGLDAGTVDDLASLEAWAASWRLEWLLDRPVHEEFHAFRYAWNLQFHRDNTLRDLFRMLGRGSPTHPVRQEIHAGLVRLQRTVETSEVWLSAARTLWEARAMTGPKIAQPPLRGFLERIERVHRETVLLVLPDNDAVQVDLDALSAATRWFRLELETGDLYSASERPSDHLAALCSAAQFLATPGEKRDRLLRRLGLPRWRRDLEDLQARVLPEPDTDAKNLLGFFVDPDAHDLVRPVRCRRTKSGTYQTRRETPRAIPAHLVTDPSERLLLDAIEGHAERLHLDRLVGHPRVFLGKDRTPTPVRLANLQVGVRATDAGHVLQLELDGEPVLDDHFREVVDGVDPGFGLLVREGALLVVPVDAATKRALHALRRFLRRPYPADATAALLSILPDLAHVFPLATDPSIRGQAVEPDPRPLVRLDWSGEELDVRIRVRPLPEVTPEVPGQGAETLLATRKEAVVHVQRDLPAEVEQVGAVAATLGLPDAAAHGFDWRLNDRDAALRVVRALQEHADALRVAWQGERVRVLDEAQVSDLTLRVRQDNDWLGLNGGVELNGETVPLDQLLRAAMEGAGHVQVASGAWIAIERTLASSLATAATAADVRTGQLSVLHAPVLEALEAEGAVIEGAPDWRDLASRMKAATLDATVPTGIQATLRPYQVEGFQWLAALAGWAPGACLADDMGLGKTLQTLCLLQRLADEGPMLVVAPTSVCINWEREAARFAPDLQILSYRGSDREKLLDGLSAGQVVVASYGVLIRDDALQAVDWRVAVLDEAQAIKNPGTARAKAAVSLKAGFRLALSGTPVENRTGELYSLMRFVAPGLLGSPGGFKQRFVSPIEGQGDRDRRALLARIVGPFVLRRTKRRVAADLPSRIEQIYQVQPSDAERKLYDRTRLEAIVRAKGASATRVQLLAELQRLRQLACHPRLLDPGSPVPSSKLRAVRRLLTDLKESGHRALVFSSFTRHLGLVREALEEDGLTVRYLDGSTPIDARQREVDAFQDGEGDVFLISLKAGGTGLNLTAATYVLHLDPWWNPAAEDQATDRAHRIGQQQTVTVYRMVTVGTIEEQIVALHAKKRELAEALLSGSGEATVLSTDDLLELLQQASAPDEGAGLAALEAELAPEAPSVRSHLTLVHDADQEAPPVEEPAPPEPAAVEESAHDEASAARLPAAAWVARFTEEHIEPSTLKPASKRAYVGALERMAKARAPAEPLSAEDCAAFFAGLRTDVKAGRIGWKSDKVFGSPAIGRITKWLEAH
jgi:superfamily II DNA or RNA helicase